MERVDSREKKLQYKKSIQNQKDEELLEMQDVQWI